MLCQNTSFQAPSFWVCRVSIITNSCKGVFRGLNLLHIRQHPRHMSTVTTRGGTTPCDNLQKVVVVSWREPGGLVKGFPGNTIISNDVDDYESGSRIWVWCIVSPSPISTTKENKRRIFCWDIIFGVVWLSTSRHVVNPPGVFWCDPPRSNNCLSYIQPQFAGSHVSFAISYHTSWVHLVYTSKLSI